MKPHDFSLKNRFFLKVILLYALLLTGGLVSGVYVIASGSLNSLLETEKRYEEQLLNRTVDFVEQLFTRLDDILFKVYIPDYYGFSLEGLISPHTDLRISDWDRDNRINEKIHTICYSHSFIIDTMLVKYPSGEFHFATRSDGRSLDSGFDFFESDLFGKLSSPDTRKRIIPDYTPEFLQEHKIASMNYPVLTVSQDLFDLDHLRTDQPIGTLIITIDPLIFSQQLKLSTPGIKGEFIITGNGNEVIYNSGEKKLLTFHPDDYPEDRYLLTRIHSDPTGLDFYNLLEKDVFAREFNYHRSSIIKVVLVTLLFLILISLLFNRTINRRIRVLLEHMGYVEQGNFDRSIDVKHSDEIGRIEEGFNDMCRRLDRYVSMVYLSEIKVKNARLKILQDQINPHFMYNTLESIQMTALMNGDPETAEMVQILGKLFRWTISSDDIIVALSEECAYIREYCRLQSIRYESNFELSVNIPEEYLTTGIPKMTFQPIVENTLYHGFGNIAQGGMIKISCRREDRCICFRIEDNGKGLEEDELDQLNRLFEGDSKDEDHAHIGLLNINNRIRMLFGDAFGIRLLSGKSEGICVEIRIPFSPCEEMRNSV